MSGLRTTRLILAWATLGILAVAVLYAFWIGVMNWSEIMV